jgi:hypothetical protein
MRPALAAALLSLALAPAPAWAGGFGLLLNGGAHDDRVYGYTEEANGDYTQDPSAQFNANLGAGLEVVLGDRDNKVLGLFRGYYLQDVPQTPVEGDLSPVREVPRDIGVVTAGLQWGVLGDPGALQGVIVSTLGAGLFTCSRGAQCDDLTEFILAEAGVGGTWMVERRVQVAASVTGGIRYRNRVLPTANAYLGVRYLFD